MGATAISLRTVDNTTTPLLSHGGKGVTEMDLLRVTQEEESRKRTMSSKTISVECGPFEGSTWARDN